MSRRQSVYRRKTKRAPKDAAADGLGGRAPESLLRDEGERSSDMQRALPHPVASEETGVHGGGDKLGVPTFLEPRPPGDSAP